MATSPLLPSPITFALWGTDETQTFERSSDVVDWAGMQKQAWEGIKPTNNQLAHYWNSHINNASEIEAIISMLMPLLGEPADQRDEQTTRSVAQQIHKLMQHLEQYSHGNILSTAHPSFGHIVAVGETDPNAGAALLIACLANGNQIFSQVPSLDAIARIGVASAYLETARGKTIKGLKADISSLKKRAEADISELRAALDEQLSQASDQAEEHLRLVEERSDIFTKLTQRCNMEWSDLKQVYDEKLALLAPTEYWSTRSTVHTKKARGYAIAFSFALALLVAVFILFGIGHLDEPGTGSVVIAVLPVLIPAFAGIWVLRILGRLLSENLKIAQDAHERETLVKTFLAFMRDETTGKSVVTNEDRTLILHALFRQSTVTAVDDTPPLHWVDILRRSKG